MSGRFHVARMICFAALIALWVVLPWIHIRGAPAIFLDVDARKFFLFGLTFNAQDTWLLFFLVSGVGFGLVYVTALAGRAWCGWACPQTVFLDGVFRRIERWIEGPRGKHVRRDAGPLTLSFVVRKIAKHLCYGIASILIAHIILAYFVSLPRELAMIRTSPAAHPEAFIWVLALTALIYGNFAWFREQFCVVMCPYGRLQSMLLDDDSLVVGYDSIRGEPRGKKGVEGAGDCVDCNRCVVVCPTGIDIRNGLQLDCIACTACIDACDDVMDQLGRERGLIRYDSTNGLDGKKTHILRPRMILYTALLVVGALAAWMATRARTDFEANLIRLSGAPYTIDGDEIRNSFDLHVVNKRGSAEIFDLQVDPIPNLNVVAPMSEIRLDSLADAHVPIFLSMPRATFVADTPFRVHLKRRDSENDTTVVVGTFLGARRP
ncbi:MAG: cytochrome c oxidase accessory protein CcoG [Polyangiaceae bacterium]